MAEEKCLGSRLVLDIIKETFGLNCTEQGPAPNPWLGQVQPFPSWKELLRVASPLLARLSAASLVMVA